MIACADGPQWDWFLSIVGRPYQLGIWDCFQLLLDGQAALGMGRAFEPGYRPGADPGRTLARNFTRGFAEFDPVSDPVPGAAVLFRLERVPVHVGLYMGPGLMAHTDVNVSTCLAEFGPGTDYHHLLSGFYVPK